MYVNCYWVIVGTLDKDELDEDDGHVILESSFGAVSVSNCDVASFRLSSFFISSLCVVI